MLIHTQVRYPPNLASSSFIFLRLEPRLRLLAGYSQSCRSREHVPHLGLTRSHFNFRFRHDAQEIVFSVGDGALSSPAWEGLECCPGPLVADVPPLAGSAVPSDDDADIYNLAGGVADELFSAPGGVGYIAVAVHEVLDIRSSA